MGDGRVALILDVLGVARKSRVLHEGNRRSTEQKAETAGEKSSGEKQSLLIIQTGKGTRAAVPLAAVQRL
jgi:two-component system chemotaxis sensor kinase CheA